MSCLRWRSGPWSAQASEGSGSQVASKPTWILLPYSLFQSLLTVLSQVLCFLAIEWYLPLLVSALVLGWLNLLYYTRGFQHTGIYSVMIQKVREGGGPEGLFRPHQARAFLCSYPRQRRACVHLPACQHPDTCWMEA